MVKGRASDSHKQLSKKTALFDGSQREVQDLGPLGSIHGTD